MKLETYVLVSTALAALTLVRALAVYPNYYSAMLSLSDDIVTLVIVCNMGVVIMMLSGLLIIKAFLSQIRSTELEDLWYRFSLLMCDTVMFWGRSTYSWLDAAPTAFILALLFALHWITGDRLKIAFYEHTPQAIIKLARLGTLIFILAYVDVKMLSSVVHEIFAGYRRVSDLTMFAPLVVDLAELSLGSVLRFILNTVEAWALAHADEDDETDEWDHKQKFSLFINIVVDLCGALGHALLMNPVEVLSIHTYKVGIRVYRVGTTIKKIRTLLKAQASLEKLAQPATAEELERDNLCLICREEMTATGHSSARKVPRRLNCGHIIHFSCLRSWMGRSDLCPTCRQPVHSNQSAFASSGPNQHAAEAAAPQAEVVAQREVDAAAPQAPAEDQSHENFTPGDRVHPNGDPAVETNNLVNTSNDPSPASSRATQDPALQPTRTTDYSFVHGTHKPDASATLPLKTGIKVSTQDVSPTMPYPFTSGGADGSRRALSIGGALYEYRHTHR